MNWDETFLYNMRYKKFISSKNVLTTLLDSGTDAMVDNVFEMDFYANLYGEIYVKPYYNAGSNNSEHSTYITNILEDGKTIISKTDELKFGASGSPELLIEVKPSRKYTIHIERPIKGYQAKLSKIEILGDVIDNKELYITKLGGE